MRRSVQNASWIMGGKLLSAASQSIFFVVLARVLGSEGYGVYVGAAALIAVVNQYGSLGSGYVFLKLVSRDPAQTQLYFGNVLLSTLTFSPLLILLLVLAAPSVLHADTRLLIFLLAFSDCTAGALTPAAAQVFQALERMSVTAAVTALNDILRLVAGVFLLVFVRHSTVLSAAYVIVAVSTCAAVLSTLVVIRMVGRPTFSWRVLSQHAGEGLTFALSNSTTIVANDIDKVMLSHYGDNAVNGIYSLAYRGISASSMPLVAIYSAMIPRFFKEGAEGIAKTCALAKRLLGKTTLLALAMGAIMFLLAPLVPWVAGPSYVETTQAMRWLAVIPVLRNLQLCAGDALSGAGRQGVRLISQGLAAVFNFGINLYLIPHFSWRGAAAASIATDGALALGLWMCLLTLRTREQAAPALVQAS